MAESMDFDEQRMVNEGGYEIEEDERVKAGEKEKSYDPDTLANPTELQGGGGSGDSPGTLDGGSAGN